MTEALQHGVRDRQAEHDEQQRSRERQQPAGVFEETQHHVHATSIRAAALRTSDPFDHVGRFTTFVGEECRFWRCEGLHVVDPPRGELGESPGRRGWRTPHGAETAHRAPYSSTASFPRRELAIDILHVLGEGARTATGFFWKAGWAFVLGYSISGMIQAFVPKQRMTRHMGDPGAKSISLATVFGAASSSCSFAALAAARSLVLKGAHFVAAVAFMFASTNLVIELGVLILIFLGWQFLAAEIVGGLLLIAISSVLIRWTYPKRWLEAAREKVESESEDDEQEFDWRQRIRSREGWNLVGQKFVSDWKMVWEEILIGFTVAGFVAVLVPDVFWAKLFLMDVGDSVPQWLIVLENAAVAPFVAAATFIGSMGNIPLATVLNANGVMFAGIMGFIYSDLMVPPLVAINAKYYGRRVALYIAAVMWVSIVITAVVLHVLFAVTGLTPESGRAVGEVAQFAFDYTFWLNLAMVGVAVVMVWLYRQHQRAQSGGSGHGGHGEGGLGVKRLVVYAMMAVLVIGLVSLLFAEPAA